MQNPQTLHTYQNERQGASTFQKVRTKNLQHKKAQQVQTKHQGAPTFQKVRTKKPSAQKAHKYKTNAKGLRPFKRSKSKNLRHKRHTSTRPTPRCSSLLSKGTNQNLWHKNTITAKTNQKPSALNEGKSAPSAKEPQFPEDANQRYPRKNRKMEARRGGDVFLSVPSASIIRPH